jgi:hypothetical protein
MDTSFQVFRQNIVRLLISYVLRVPTFHHVVILTSNTIHETSRYFIVTILLFLPPFKCKYSPQHFVPKRPQSVLMGDHV